MTIAHDLGKPPCDIWEWDALLVRLDPPLRYFNPDKWQQPEDDNDPACDTYGEPNDTAEHVVVSLTRAFGCREFGTFATDEFGQPGSPMYEIREMSGRGNSTHAEALAYGGYILTRPDIPPVVFNG